MSMFHNYYVKTYKRLHFFYEIINICPELNELFLSGKIQSKAIQIRDFQYNDMVRHLEHLSQENLVSYAFNQTIMNGVGTLKGGQIVLTPHYLQDVLSLLR